MSLDSLPGRAPAGDLQQSGSAIWHYRRFILASVVREFRARYARSYLGATWLVLAPFAMILIYTLVFSGLMQARLPGTQQAYAYSVYLCAGLLPWHWFSELVSRNTGLFLDHAGLIKKHSFPRLSLPIINALASGLNFALAMSVFLVFLLVMGNWPGWSLLWMIPLLLLQLLFASSLGLMLGVLNVFFRDVGQAMGIVLQFWFWLTPIIYPLTALPERIRRVIEWNPMTPLVQAYQGIFLGQGQPDWPTLLPLALVTLLFTGLAAKSYRAARNQIVDEL
jgi:lipopolysaccharide transport system permease protein